MNESNPILLIIQSFHSSSTFDGDKPTMDGADPQEIRSYMAPSRVRAPRLPTRVTKTTGTGAVDGALAGALRFDLELFLHELMLCDKVALPSAVRKIEAKVVTPGGTLG